MIRLLLVGVLLAFLTFPATAERRVALVIGNSAYLHVPRLTNPVRDARLMSDRLSDLGFEVVEGRDLTFRSFRQVIADFIERIQGADLALFYYAGHGLQMNGQNFMIPVNAKLASQIDIEFEAVPIDLVLGEMEATARTSLLFLDACRDNPLRHTLASSMGSRSATIGRGLARIGAGKGTLIAFATQPGNIALDGKGENSPFSGALGKFIGTPGESISDSMIRVRNEVIRETDGKQVPWEHSSLTGRIVLREGPLPTGGSNGASIEAAQHSSEVQELNESLQAELSAARTAREAAEQARRELEARLAALAEDQHAPDMESSETQQRPAAKPTPKEAPTNGIASRVDQVASLDQGQDSEQRLTVTEESTDLVRSIQTELNRLGCDAGTVDGIWGRSSSRALSDYRRSIGSVNELDTPTVELLSALRGARTPACKHSPARLQTGDLYVGRWGAHPSSIEFLSLNPLRVKYCFRDICSIHFPEGSASSMRFRFSNPNARMKIVKRGSTFHGEHKVDGDTGASIATFYKKR